MENIIPIVRVLVGSKAHGLDDPDSDSDYRSVYALPTEKILSLNFKYKGSTWLEGDSEDNTAWEIGHFLSLAQQNNPTILEVFFAPKDRTVEESVAGAYFSKKLGELFPYIFHPVKAFNAFCGYGKNQQKKFLDKKDNRPHKYAAAHIRTLYNLIELLKTGTMTIRVGDKPDIGPTLKRIKHGEYRMGEIVDLTHSLELEAQSILDLKRITTEIKNLMNDKTENEIDIFSKFPEEVCYEKVNDFLLEVREAFWNV